MATEEIAAARRSRSAGCGFPPICASCSRTRAHQRIRARWSARSGAGSRRARPLARRVREISEAAEQLRDSLESADRLATLAAVRRGGAAMEALGYEARVPIVTPELARACALASAAGAAGKPSGAGGGDCAVILALR